MNSKILIAFVTGALIASGIVYLAVRPEAEPKPAAASVAIARPALPPAPAPVESPAPPVAAQVPPVPAPVHEKPSPMPPPVRREKPVTMARNEEPPPVVQEPAPEPVKVQVPSEPEPPAAAPAPPPVSAPVSTPPENVPPAQPAPEVRVPHTVTIASGTVLPVRIGETITAAHYRQGDSFLATLDQPLVVDGFIIAERGSRLEGCVVEAVPSSRGNGVSHLGIELVKLSTADGQHIQIHTVTYRKEAASSAGNDAAKVAGGAALGAAIGGIAGGGKGAAIGVGAGAAAGVAGVILTRGKQAEIPVETRISFRIADPVTITERLD